ncbi:MAG: Holliday junction branch migration protein RuvA [Acidimicrobiia bacterium]
MISRLRGMLVAITPDGVVVEVGGVGYEIAMTPQSVSGLAGIGEEVVVHTHLQVREDSMSLYGFATATDRDLFRVLISASGVGPKVGMALLATMRPEQLRRAVATEDVAALCAAPGVGKRSAQKIILELRPKLADAEADLAGGSDQGQVRQALENLGYSHEEIAEAVADLDPGATASEQLKSALRALGQARRA